MEIWWKYVRDDLSEFLKQTFNLLATTALSYYYVFLLCILRRLNSIQNIPVIGMHLKPIAINRRKQGVQCWCWNCFFFSCKGNWRSQGWQKNISLIFPVNGTLRYLQKTCVLLYTAGVFICRYRWVSVGQLHRPSSFPGVPICTCVLALPHGTQPWARSAPFFNQPCSTPALTLLAESVVPAQWAGEWLALWSPATSNQCQVWAVNRLLLLCIPFGLIWKCKKWPQQTINLERGDWKHMS